MLGTVRFFLFFHLVHTEREKLIDAMTTCGSIEGVQRIRHSYVFGMYTTGSEQMRLAERRTIMYDWDQGMRGYKVVVSGK